MPPQQNPALESCERAETMLRNVQQRALNPGTGMLAECEIELGQVAAVLEALHVSMTEGSAARGNAAIRQALLKIRRASGQLSAQFEHGSNYCMGWLQARLGTGYSEQGQPMLAPSAASSSFEG